jgi:thiol:disulfide interchange protein DsbC
MRLHRKLLGALTALAIVAGCTATSDPPASTATAESVRKAIQERVGGDGKVGDVRRSPAGVWEVQVGSNVYYTDDQANYLFIGRLIDMRTRENITQARLDELLRVDLKTLPLDYALKAVKGKGERTLIVFADPNCRYCKVLEKDALPQLDNVTVYTFLVPILSEDSTTKSRQIWCASDRMQVWDAWMLRNQAPMGRGDCDVPIEPVVQLAERLGVTATPTMIFADGGRVSGALPADQIEARLAQAAQPK